MADRRIAMDEILYQDGNNKDIKFKYNPSKDIKIDFYQSNWGDLGFAEIVIRKEIYQFKSKPTSIATNINDTDENASWIKVTFIDGGINVKFRNTSATEMHVIIYEIN